MKSNLENIKAKLYGVIQKEDFVSAWTGLFKTIFALLIVFAIFILLGTATDFSSGIRTFMFAAVIIVGLILFALFVIRPIVRTFYFPHNSNYLPVAKRIGNHFPDIKDELINSIQIMSDESNDYSNELINAAFEKTYNKTKDLDFTSIVSYDELKKYFRLTYISAIILISFVLIFPGIKSSAYKIINYDKEFVIPPKYSFIVSPGDSTITKGADVEINISTKAEYPSKIRLMTKFIEQTTFEEEILNPDSFGIFKHKMRTVLSKFDYYVEAGDSKSDIYSIEVISRPVISTFNVTIIPPGYSGQPILYQKDNGNITALPGSRIKIDLLATKDLSVASLLFSNKSEIDFDIYGSSASINFVLNEDDDYRFYIEDENRNSNSNPIKYTIKKITDDFPLVTMIKPEQNYKLSTEDKLSLISKIKDDYGFTKLVLNYRLSASRYIEPQNIYSQIRIPLNEKSKEDEIYYVWDLAPMVLAESDVVTYYLEIFDNDNISGPKSAKSKIHTISVPSLDELFAEVETDQNNVENDLVESLKEAEKLKEELEKISNELKQDDKEISWQEKEKIEKSLDKMGRLTEKIENAKSALEKVQKDLMKNNLLSPETLAKYMELQELMDEIGSEEMKEAMKRMQEMLQNLMRNQVQQSFEDMKMNEDYIRQSIERTLNLLKRIQAEQKLDEVIKRVEDAENKIDELSKEIEKSDSGENADKERLSKKQDQLTEDLNRLKEEMDKLNENLKEIDNASAMKMENILKEFEKQENQKLSESASEEINNGNMTEAGEAQQMLQQNMSSLGDAMKNLQMDLQSQYQMKIFYAMLKSLNNILMLSEEEEKLKKVTQSMLHSENEFVERAKEQDEIQRNLSKVINELTELSQETFAITPELGKAIGKARWEMTQVISALNNRNAPIAVPFEKNAMTNLNKAAAILKSSLEMMMQGGQGGGMMSLMQQLQQMAEQQMNLNQLTKMLQQGAMSQEMMQQLQRLSQQQEALRKSLAQLNREAFESAQSSKLTSDLNKILDEMKEVVEKLESNNVDDNLLQKQERILSRLLEAQRSMNERDFEEERESRSGDIFKRESPQDFDMSHEGELNRLRDELLKAIDEGYRKDYEDLIRKYFEILEQEFQKKAP